MNNQAFDECVLLNQQIKTSFYLVQAYTKADMGSLKMAPTVYETETSVVDCSANQIAAFALHYASRILLKLTSFWSF